ncbi:hypothetical protein [Lyngbya confervoides]|uniref:Uncharacterized protein n=1 Tax=Lyngbya confervoides BDU141951 TaxID=1574623 RepID=A0ABD4T1Z6_9CYAN|nr:hypothetical protein [Lyngbya confervoides]MCM1982406.1 hypothetical protein [Lyngbya confervoides BDU141951]
MARPTSEKCRRCAQQSVEVAQAKDCWEGQKCHVRRSNYKTRDLRNRQRRKQYRMTQEGSPVEAEGLTATGGSMTTQVIAVPVPESVAAIVHLWRQNKTAPLHAIGAELLRNGEKAIVVEPVHTLGWTAMQVKQYMRDVLQSLSEHVGQEIDKFEAQVEHGPDTCRIEDCPLHRAGG